jgi:hypothetical protein
MSDWMNYNLARMSDIGGRTSRRADRAFAGKEASKGRLFDTIGDYISSLRGQREAEKQRGFISGESALDRAFRAEEAGKQRGFASGEAALGRDFDRESQLRKIESAEEAAKLLADARVEELQWARTEGFEQQKELEKLRADSRAALARLEASLRPGADAEDFNIEEAFAAVMSYATLGTGNEWSATWAPENWNQEAKDKIMRSADLILSRYGENADIVKAMVVDYLDKFPMTEAGVPDVAEGVGDTSGVWYPPLDYASRPYALDVESPEYTPTEEDLANPLYGVRGRDVGSYNWNLMYQMLNKVSPEAKQNPQLQAFIKEASDGKIEPNILSNFIDFLMKMKDLQPTLMRSGTTGGRVE